MTAPETVQSQARGKAEGNQKTTVMRTAAMAAIRAARVTTVDQRRRPGCGGGRAPVVVSRGVAVDTFSSMTRSCGAPQ